MVLRLVKSRVFAKGVFSLFVEGRGTSQALSLNAKAFCGSSVLAEQAFFLRSSCYEGKKKIIPRNQVNIFFISLRQNICFDIIGIPFPRVRVFI